MTVGVWDNFAVISGSAAGALTGLLFVAVSLNRDRIMSLLIVVAGCLPIAGGNGLYWLAAAEVLALTGGVVNAWLFLTRADAVLPIR